MKKFGLVFLICITLSLLLCACIPTTTQYEISVDFGDGFTVDGNNVTFEYGNIFSAPQAKLVDAQGNKYRATIKATLKNKTSGQVITDTFIIPQVNDEYTLTYHVESYNADDITYNIVCKDTTAPIITFEQPEETCLVGSSLVLTATATDTGDVPIACEFEVNYASIASSKGNGYALQNDNTLVMEEEGYYHITVSAEDASGNMAQQTCTVHAVLNAISLKNNNLVKYSVVAKNNSSWEVEAKSFVVKYLQSDEMRAIYNSSTGSGKKITIECNSDADFDPEYFEITVDESFNVTIYGGVRGVIYGAFELLERCGFGFYTIDLETHPTEYVSLKPVDLMCSQTSGMKYRSVLGNTVGQGWGTLLKFRLNSLWQRSDIPYETYGGTYYYAGTQAHTLTGESGCLLADYVSTNPEYFALVDGTRRTDRKGQMCFSSEGAKQAVIANVKSWLQAKPKASLVSVTLGDNNNYCQCDSCKAKYSQGYTVTDLYMQLVDDVAKAIKDEYPNVLVQCFSYGGASGAPTKITKVSDNVICQYCCGDCKAHAIDNPNCAVNVEACKNIEKWSSVCSNLLVWDYPLNFKYCLASTPQIKDFLANAKYFYEQGTFGMFQEYMHSSGINGATFDELKTYLLTKIMWNPTMTDEEYEKHVANFMKAYYGDGWEYLRQYISLYESYAGRDGLHYDYDMGIIDPDGQTASSPAVSLLIPQDKVSEFLAKAYELWSKAEELATDEQLTRILKDKTQLVYLDLCLTMDDILENGTQAEKTAVIAKNAKLISMIKQYNLRITFWGQTTSSQYADLDKNVSPLNWDYNW